MQSYVGIGPVTEKLTVPHPRTIRHRIRLARTVRYICGLHLKKIYGTGCFYSPSPPRSQEKRSFRSQRATNPLMRFFNIRSGESVEQTSSAS